MFASSLGARDLEELQTHAATRVLLEERLARSRELKARFVEHLVPLCAVILNELGSSCSVRDNTPLTSANFECATENNSHQSDFIYELPFGHGGKWLSQGDTWNCVLGGWSLGVQLGYHSGLPMAAISNGFSYGGWSKLFANVDQSSGNLSNQFKGLDLINRTDASNLIL